jgi:hypothetical protein
MHRMRTGTASLAFRLSIERALDALYKRRAEIEDLMACLESQTSWTENSKQLANTRPQGQTARTKSPCFASFLTTPSKLT